MNREKMGFMMGTGFGFLLQQIFYVNNPFILMFYWVIIGLIIGWAIYE